MSSLSRMKFGLLVDFFRLYMILVALLTSYIIISAIVKVKASVRRISFRDICWF